METEDPEAWDASIHILEQDSGSDYEELDAEEQDFEQGKEYAAPRTSRANSTTRRGRSKNRGRKARSPFRDQSGSDDEKSRDSSTESQRQERQQAAAEWAATFQEPESSIEIRSPTRHAAGTQSKRKAVKPPSQVRAKRLKSWYNNDYRELLNVDIHDAVARSIAEDQIPLDGSQVGSSIWTSNEKDLFFAALSRLGRDNIREIASRVETKSELEVQEYIQLLYEGMMEKSNKLLGTTDLPAAIEISNECCDLLERAGDALASRQERAEEEMEEEKWRDLWLLNSDTNKRFDKQQKDQAGRNNLEETFPAANFFHLRNWLELSRRIFMNPDSEEDNWESLAETGETPAIRATAFEDFHSLVVNITKRLISTTLFCTMSRQRALGSKTIKHAEINQDDVEAAVKILGLKLSSKDFWINGAKRCNLKVFDDEWDSFLSHEEVEKALRETARRERSRFLSHRERSVSCAAQFEVDTEETTESESYSEDYGSDEVSLVSNESNYTRSEGMSDDELTDYPTEGEGMSSKSRKERSVQKARAKKEAERAYEKYVEAFDNEAIRGEEQRLWMLLRQTAPFDIKLEPIDLMEQPKGIFRDDMLDQAHWRDWVNYRTQWETMEKPVPTVNFDRNRRRVTKRAKRRMERGLSQRELDSLEDKDAGSSVESDEENESLDQRQDCFEELRVLEHEDQDHPEIQELAGAPVGSDNEANEVHDNAQDNFREQDDDHEIDNYVESQWQLENELPKDEHRSLMSPSKPSEDLAHSQAPPYFQDSGSNIGIKGNYDSS